MEDKPWYKSKTTWGALFLAGGMLFTTVGNFLSGTIDSTALFEHGIQAVGAFLSIFGIRSFLAKA